MLNPPRYVQLVASHRKATGQNCACRVARPVVSTGKVVTVSVTGL